MHKVISVHGNQKALEIEIKFADWVGSVIGPLNDEQIQDMLHCEHGGMNEVLADLYADTNNKKYLELADKFYHKAILDSLAAGVDILPDKHGNTQIPKLIGLALMYELTGNEKDKKAAEFFWERVVDHHSYVTGGHGNHEYFGQPDQLRNRLSDETTETCNVYNMLKLSRHLFQWNPRAKIADFYERALFNHILASQNPENGRVVYNLSLEMGGFKAFQNPEDFTCCIGTGMENHAKYGSNIYFKNDDELYVCQFIASELNWAEKGIKLVQRTNFPETQQTSITIEGNSKQQYTIQIRYPYWARNGLTVAINGVKEIINQQPGSFIRLKRKWMNGDQIAVDFPFSLRLETMPDDSNRVAVIYGPLVLAGDLGPISDPYALEHDYVPVLLTEDRNPSHWLQPQESSPNIFSISADVAHPRSFKLIPFYRIHDRRYSVYWDMFTADSWKLHQEAYQNELKRKKDLGARTIDYFQPGEMQPERNHDFKGENVRVMEFRHKKARVADRGGWFEFQLKTIPDKNIALVVHYWGGFTGSKTFDILVNGTKVATENISGKQDGAFIDIEYPIGPELIDGKNKITIRFDPHTGNRAGPIFGARTIIK